MFKRLFNDRRSNPDCSSESDRIEVKQAAILHVDIVGSTRLVQENLCLAHRQIRHLYGRICRLSAAQNGVARELRGDAAVVEFESAADALRAALAIHAAHAMIDKTRLGRINPQLRTGLSYGAVISEENMITGEAVIRAQRLEQLAQPGQVFVDDCLREALPDDCEFKLESMGVRRLKGFDSATTVYLANRRGFASMDTLARHFNTLALPHSA